jgi:thiol-disulfide isomerase/thioredoxin
MAKHLAENCPTWFAPVMRRSSLKYGSLILFFSVLMAGPAQAQTVLPDLSHHLTEVAEPQLAKNFTFKDLDGKTRTLSDYRGKVVLVNFWATWCPPCRREMPSLERLNQKLQGEPFIILAVDQWESYDLVFAFTGQLDPQPTFPILFDSKSQASKQWDVKGLPASFIVDKKGRVVYRAMGGREFDHPEIEQLIRNLLKE